MKRPNGKEPDEMKLFALTLSLVFALSLSGAGAAEAQGGQTSPQIHTVGAIALFGEPKYGPDAKHFDYVNPDAPKGGTVHMSAPGTYDTFNPYIVRGTPDLMCRFLCYDTLLAASGDEDATEYGLVAQKITYPDDYAWVEFTINPKAKWHDGKPITPDDVVFSLETLQKEGSPTIKGNIDDVASAKVTGKHTVRFTFKQGKRGAILDAGLMPVLPKHYWQGKDFSSPTITPPLTSGPYKIGKFDLGRSVTYVRVKDYWAKDLPINVGRWNYDELDYDYYRDLTVAGEAFKAGKVDIRWETSTEEWAKGYQFPAAKRGLVKRMRLKVGGGVLFGAYFFNLRHPEFQDERVREAMNYAFDFAWLNKNIFYGLYRRQMSYFGPNDHAAAGHGLPSPLELKLLAPYKNEVPARVFTKPVALPDTDGTEAGLRKNLRTAFQLLSAAGYQNKNGQLVSTKTGKPLSFEILTSNATSNAVTAHWIANLKLLGINARVRAVDSTQFVNRTRSFDYDVLSFWVPQIGTPGAEQRARWGSASAAMKGSYNYIGIKNPAVDGLIGNVIHAKDKPTYIAALRALDRVLMWNFYCVPQVTSGGALNMAYWNRFGMPKTQPWFGQAYTSVWWVDPAKDKALIAARSGSSAPTGSAVAAEPKQAQ
jgi:microcin C transport system substrate-binding protein